MFARRSSKSESKSSKKINLKSDWQQLRRLLQFTRPYRGILVFGMFTTLISSGLSLVFPALFGQLIDASFLKMASASTAKLDQTVLLLLVVFAVSAAFAMAQTYLLGKVSICVVADLRRQLFAHLIELSPRFFVNQRTGDLGSRLNADTSTISHVVSNVLASAASQVVSLLGAGILLVMTSPKLSLVAAVLIPLIIIIAIFVGLRFKDIGRNLQDSKAAATAGAEEAIIGIRVVQSFTAEELEKQRYNRGVQKIFGFGLDQTRLSAFMGGVMSFLSFSSLAIILWYGGRLVIAGDMTPGNLVTFLFYAFQAGGTIAGMTGLYAQVQEALGASGRVFELLDEKSELTNPLVPHRVDFLQGSIRFEQVSFSYDAADDADSVDDDVNDRNATAQVRSDAPTDAPNTPPKPPKQTALHNIDLEIAAGQVVALVGPSGAGKTTFASLIPRFWDVSSGRVCLDGMDVRDYTLQDVRSYVGLVPQETLLFSGSIRDNILYGRSDATPDEVEEAARSANAHEFIQKLSEGYDTLVGERGVKLSGGQRQRIAIARAILKDPRILILDEATSSLDNESEAVVQAALERLMVGRTTVVIAHRLSTIRNADRIVVLRDGRVIEDGSHEELMIQNGLYKELYQQQYARREHAKSQDGANTSDHDHL